MRIVITIIGISEQNYNRFISIIKSAAKKIISLSFRKKYTLCWNSVTNSLDKEYLKNQGTDTANNF